MKLDLNQTHRRSTFRNASLPLDFRRSDRAQVARLTLRVSHHALGGMLRELEDLASCQSGHRYEVKYADLFTIKSIQKTLYRLLDCAYHLQSTGHLRLLTRESVVCYFIRGRRLKMSSQDYLSMRLGSRPRTMRRTHSLPVRLWAENRGDELSAFLRNFPVGARRYLALMKSSN